MKKTLKKTTRFFLLLLVAVSIPASFLFAQDTKLRKKETSLLILEFPTHENEWSKFPSKLKMNLEAHYFNVVFKPSVQKIVKKEKGKSDTSIQTVSKVHAIDKNEYKSVYTLKMQYHLDLKNFRAQLIDNSTGKIYRNITNPKTLRRSKYGWDVEGTINYVTKELNRYFVTN
ncbi:hypothetical protein [Marinifilum caeruleilacunae]|uniref:DUF4468 domain-containing protein n=1 Tax=Marinifilum caeruleilacunae TaxID=2499076 RepID=A0ABX1WUL4_9BACT|nr:hypothetical protein [Marinifilum caeruleilacunae]NOU59671.1 hypothetical protein [Marinifilum caeruleilacunae]